MNSHDIADEENMSCVESADNSNTTTLPAGNGGLQSYEYKSLPKGKYIRYLVLNPGKDDEPLSGSLVVEQIDQVLEFDAISYVWGAHSFVGQINCDGKSIPLTANLRDALRRVRLSNTTRNVWADQISINQRDLVERGHQVALMARIYRESRTTLIWLGDAEDGTVQEVYSLIKDVNELIRGQLLENDGSWDNMPAIDSTNPISYDQRWVSFAKMTDCAWFRRVWVVQEAGLSVRPRILYGKRNMDWKNFIIVLNWLRHRGSHIAYQFHIEWHAIHMDKEHLWPSAISHEKQESAVNDSSSAPGYPWTLLDILSASRQLEASEPKDHIYAFLGHSSASHSLTGELIVNPDYTIDTMQMYCDFAVAWLEWTRDLNILSFVQHRDATATDDPIPSWVPTWNTYDSSVLAQNGVSNFKAGASSKILPQVFKGGKRLKVRGATFDKIVFRSSVFYEHDFDWGNKPEDEVRSPKDVSKWTEILSHVLDPASNYIYADERRFMTCATTLAAGIYSGSQADFDSRATAFLSPFLPTLKSYSEYSSVLLQVAHKTQTADGSNTQLCEMEMATAMINRRFVVTERGYHGLAPALARVGDVCCVVFGANTPFIVRPAAQRHQHFELVGEAYVHGVMKGEIFERSAGVEFQEEDIVLV